MMETQHSYFHHFINSNKQSLIVQPRMGFSNFNTMRKGLDAVKKLDVPSIGTITLDSFTRIGDFKSTKRAIEEGHNLNGYPIVSYEKQRNKQLIKDLIGSDFPVQVRHGSARPEAIFKSIIEAGIDATEGGPVSYCFPYGQVPLKDSIASWRTCSEMFAIEGQNYHLESFGGCMMGQLCPPAMLIAVTVLEAIFFKSFGVNSFSVSLTQGTNQQQDIAALIALRRIGEKYLGSNQNWHIVFYTFMGRFPISIEGAEAILRDSVLIAKFGKAARLIVKTTKEAHQIPTIQDNLLALEQAHNHFQLPLPAHFKLPDSSHIDQIFEEADFLLDLVLNMDANIELALSKVFQKGYWDIPFCLHPDNNKKTLAKLDKNGLALWLNTGKIPFPKYIKNYHSTRAQTLSSGELLDMLSFNQRKYDNSISVY